jgi:hypothetical protein
MAYDDATRTSLLPSAKPLDCPDCGVAGALRIDWKDDRVGGASRVLYRCVTPKCRGTLAARSDGSPVGTPADARTRSGRKVLQERLGRIWRQADGVASEMLVAEGKTPLRRRESKQLAQARGRELLYRWVAWTLRRDSSKARVSQMDAFDLSTVAAACDGIKDDFRAVVAWSKSRKGADSAKRRHAGASRKAKAGGSRSGAKGNGLPGETDGGTAQADTGRPRSSGRQGGG